VQTINFRTSFAAPLAGLAAAFAIAAAPAAAGEVLIVDTGDPTQTNGGYTLLNASAIQGFPAQSIAARFTVDQDLSITSIEGWVGRFSAGPSTYHITLYADGPGPNHWVPGAQLYTVGLSDGGPGNGYIGTDGLDWAVTAGAYWVGFEVLATDTLFGFMPYFVPRPLQEAIGPPGAYNPAPGAPGSAFRIAGSIPEPGTWALMILGFAAAGGALRRRTLAV
jgi:hypothetical protein